MYWHCVICEKGTLVPIYVGDALFMIVIIKDEHVDGKRRGVR